MFETAELQHAAAADAAALFAPTAADATIATKVFAEARIPVLIYRSLDALMDGIRTGVGAIVLTYECLARPEHGELEAMLALEPAWSNIPFIVLMRTGTRLSHADSKLHALKNAVLLERPVPVATFVAANRAALASRRRQYEIRDLLQAARRDSAERSILHANAVEARAAAESANRMKDEFLAVVSHELRTPLNAILGWATLLNRGRLDEARTSQAVETIERNAKAQAQLIEDLLDVSRIISGTLRLDAQQVDLERVIEEALGTVGPVAEAKGLQIAASFDPTVQPVAGDAARLRQVVWNLLSNAVKFTPRGGRIQIGLERAGSFAQIRVSDTGQGIAQGHLLQIFERFRQVDSTSTRTYGGLGLGLSIVRQLVELHGGSVVAESEGEGHGATFLVRLPVATSGLRREPRDEDSLEAPKPRTDMAESVTLREMRILVIDDEPDSMKVLATALSESGAEVLLASSARAGLDIYSESNVTAIVCDIGMPHEDGYSFIRRVRELEAANGRSTPAIALTAYARTEDRMRARAAGFQMHVAKPADPLALVTLVARLAKNA